MNCATAASRLLASSLAPTHVTATPMDTNTTDLERAEWRLGVGFEGFSLAIDYQVDKTYALMAATGLETDHAEVYDAVSGCFDDLYAAMQPRAFHLRGQFPLGRLMAVVAAAGHVMVKNPVLLDLGCGALRAGLEHIRDEEWDAICAVAADNDGQVILEKAPQTFKARHDVFGMVRPEWQLMHRIKKALDPEGVFAPGTLPGKV